MHSRLHSIPACTRYGLHVKRYTLCGTRYVVHFKRWFVHARISGCRRDGGRREHSQDTTKTSALFADVGSMSVVKTYSSLVHPASYHHLYCYHTGLTQRHGPTSRVCVLSLVLSLSLVFIHNPGLTRQRATLKA